MVAICVNEAFSVSESGVLQVRIAGDPADTPWPYPSDPTVDNGLRLDPTQGLWAPPVGDWRGYSEFAGDGNLGGVNSTGTRSTVVEVTVTNPSANREAFVDLTIAYRVVATMASGSTAQMDVGYYRDGTGDIPLENRATASHSATGALAYSMNYTERLNDDMEPGETSTWSYQALLRSALGTVTFTGSDLLVAGFVIVP